MGVETDFSLARRFLRDRFDNDHNKAIRHLAGRKFVAKATLVRLFNESILDESFLEPVRDKVIQMFPQTHSSRLYMSLADMAQLGPNETKKLLIYVGRYRYFRNTISGTITSGTIDIFPKGEVYFFSHSNEPKAGEFPMSDPDHNGFVFQLGQRIHLLGIGPRYIRPIVMHECPNPEKEPVHGFVITTTEQSRGGRLFAARFVMFKQTHPKFKLKRPDKEITSVLSESSAQIGILTIS